MRISRSFLALSVLLLIACERSAPQAPANSLEDLRGQWVLINYWAQWCKPCIEEIPELNAFNRKREDVAVLGVNFEGTTGPELDSQVAQLGVTFPTIDDPSAELGIPRPSVLPTTLIVGPDGVFKGLLLGPQTEETLSQAIEAHSEVNAP